MDDEPRGHTIDGTPWEEPRPPHLPDTLTRISLWVIPFLVLAGFQLVAGWREWAGQGQLNPGYGVTIFLGLVPGVCASLLGAALFYRHPSANRRLSILVFGVVLLAVTALMELASRPLDEWFLALSPSADFSSSFTLSAIYGDAVAVVRLFGLAYLARGLASARRFEDVVSGRRVATVVIVFVVIETVLWLLPIAGSIAETPDLLTPLNFASVALNFVTKLAWSYIFVITFGGWIARERPRIGWLLVAFAAGIEVALPVLFAVGGFAIWQASVVAAQIIGLISVSNWVLLLLAFMVGVPSTAEVAAPDEPDAAATADPPAATRPGSAAG